MTSPRSGQQQLNEEIAQMFKEMTDPEEQEKARIAQEEEEGIQLVTSDAGL